MDHAAASSGCSNVHTGDYTSIFKTTKTFKSKEDLIKWAREVGRLNDIVIVTLRSDNGKGNKRPRVTLGCERSGKCDKRNTPKKSMMDKCARQRTGTKKCDCPFQLMGKKLAVGDEWKLIVVAGLHNHALGFFKEGHSFAGKLSQEEQSLLKGMSERGKQPKEILTALKWKDNHNRSTLRTIYNGCKRLKHLGKLEDDSFWRQELRSKATDDHSVCSCAIRHTHGHEIAKSNRDGRPIPLECIDSCCRKLDLETLRKTGEYCVDVRMKRPRLNEEMNTSIHSASPYAGPCIVHSKQDRHSEKGCNIQSTKQLEFVDVCPLILRPFILNVKDVVRDGHCGFRAVASFLGYSDEVGWQKMREDLRNELMFNSAHYAQLFGSDKRVYELLDALAYYKSSCPEKKHWMTIPDMGHIIASCYNIVLMHLSSVQCHTFFPLRTASISISVSSPIEIAIGLVNEHFVQVFLEPGHPMPPTVPAIPKKYKNMPHIATDWERFHEQRSINWASPYSGHMENFKSLQLKVVSQKYPFVFDIDPMSSIDNMDVFFDS